MSEETKEIMYESDEAAKFVTGISGWVSSTGRFFGKDERAARYDGSTHHICECGKKATRSYTCCEDCRAKHDRERYFAMPQVPFDQVECCMLFESDKFFFEHGDVQEYLEENDLKPEDILLQVCEASETLAFVQYDQWNDELPEDHELPPEIEKAIDALNEVIKQHSPTVWWGVKKRTTFTA